MLKFVDFLKSGSFYGIASMELVKFLVLKLLLLIFILSQIVVALRHGSRIHLKIVKIEMFLGFVVNKKIHIVGF